MRIVERLRGRAGQRQRERRLRRTNGLCERCRVFRSAMRLGQGIAAPRLGHTGRRSVENVGPDELLWYVNE